MNANNALTAANCRMISPSERKRPGNCLLTPPKWKGFTQKCSYPDASFDGFLIRGAQVLSCKTIPIQEVSDHFPAILTIAIISSIRRAKDDRVKVALMPLRG